MPPALWRMCRSAAMSTRATLLSRRRFLAGCAATGVNLVQAEPMRAQKKALIAISLDLEMSRNFPTWETTHWDYEKGNLNDDTKKYTAESYRRVKAAGGGFHCFAVGPVFETENGPPLEDTAQARHPIRNPTYDHFTHSRTQPDA